MAAKIYMAGRTDNVATALQSLEPGPAAVTGAVPGGAVRVTETVQSGHKVALCDIRQGEDIRKYNVRIGRAARDIKTGEWVHIHNIRSCFDENMDHVDAETGAVKDTPYV